MRRRQRGMFGRGKVMRHRPEGEFNPEKVTTASTDITAAAFAANSLSSDNNPEADYITVDSFDAQFELECYLLQKALKPMVTVQLHLNKTVFPSLAVVVETLTRPLELDKDLTPTPVPPPTSRSKSTSRCQDTPPPEIIEPHKVPALELTESTTSILELDDNMFTYISEEEMAERLAYLYDEELAERQEACLSDEEMAERIARFSDEEMAERLAYLYDEELAERQEACLSDEEMAERIARFSDEEMAERLEKEYPEARSIKNTSVKTNQDHVKMSPPTSKTEEPRPKKLPGPPVPSEPRAGPSRITSSTNVSQSTLASGSTKAISRDPRIRSISTEITTTALPPSSFYRQFRPKKHVPLNSSDPPPGTCHNCWSPYHRRAICPHPARKYCSNCGRWGVDVINCPRCGKEYVEWKARDNKRRRAKNRRIRQEKWRRKISIHRGIHRTSITRGRGPQIRTSGTSRSFSRAVSTTPPLPVTVARRMTYAQIPIYQNPPYREEMKINEQHILSMRERSPLRREEVRRRRSPTPGPTRNVSSNELSWKEKICNLLKDVAHLPTEIQVGILNPILAEAEQWNRSFSRLEPRQREYGQ